MASPPVHIVQTQPPQPSPQPQPLIRPQPIVTNQPQMGTAPTITTIPPSMHNSNVIYSEQQTCTITTMSPNSGTAKSAHHQTTQENEQFGLAWLRATFEPAAAHTSRIEQQDLYKMYLTACSKVGHTGHVPIIHFPRCVRNVFGPSVGPITVKISKNNMETTALYYEGIRIRAHPLAIVHKGTILVSSRGVRMRRQLTLLSRVPASGSHNDDRSAGRRHEEGHQSRRHHQNKRPGNHPDAAKPTRDADSSASAEQSNPDRRQYGARRTKSTEHYPNERNVVGCWARQRRCGPGNVHLSDKKSLGEQGKCGRNDDDKRVRSHS